MWKVLLTTLIAAGWMGAAAFAQDAAKTPPAKTGASKEAHLGIGVEPVPSALYSHMSGILTKGQGVLIEQVAKDSPAAKAGLQADDVLTSFGDQKIHSPEQLVKLVRADKPGQTVNVGYIRAGKSMTCKVTLSATEPMLDQDNPRVFRFRPDHRMRSIFEEFEGQANNGVWQTFDSIKLSRTDGKHWTADVQYRSQDGKKVAKHYTGTRDEIRKAIEAEKDVPANERSQMLHALNLHEPVFEFHFPSFGPMGSGRFNEP